MMSCLQIAMPAGSCGKVLGACCMQVYETQTELTEAREELELVKLKLEVADQEAQAAKRQAAEATAATAATAALLQAHHSPGLLSPINRRSLSREVGSSCHAV